MTNKKKLYAITCECEEGYIGVIHHTAKEAIKCGRDYLRSQFCECEFIDFKCKWNKDFDISKLDDMSIGAVEDWTLGLKKGIYSYICGVDCPECNEGDCMVSLIDDKLMCSECEEKQNNVSGGLGE